MPENEVTINRSLRLQQLTDTRFSKGTNPADLMEELELRTAIVQQEKGISTKMSRLMALKETQIAIAHEEHLLHGWNPVMSSMREYLNYEQYRILGSNSIEALILAATDEAKRLEVQITIEENPEKGVVTDLLRNKVMFLEEYKASLHPEELRTIEIY